MITKIVAFTLVCALLVVQPLALAAQTAANRDDWNAVKAVSLNSKLRVETKNGERAEGNLTDVSDSALTIARKSKNTNFNRVDVRKIYVLKSGSRATSALIGAGAGAGAGAGIALGVLGATNGSDDSASIIGTGILIGVGIGTALGALVGKGGKRVLIYESN